MQQLETQRLILRDWNVDDCYDLFEYARLPEVALNAGWLPHKNLEESLGVITEIYPNSCYAIELKNSGKIIGNIGFHHTSLCKAISALKSREIGFNLNPNFWGNGFMTEAALEVCRYCFEQLCVDYLWYSHFPDNKKSQRIAQKLGFHYIFTRDNARYLESTQKAEIFYIKTQL